MTAFRTSHPVALRRLLRCCVLCVASLGLSLLTLGCEPEMNEPSAGDAAMTPTDATVIHDASIGGGDDAQGGEQAHDGSVDADGGALGDGDGEDAAADAAYADATTTDGGTLAHERSGEVVWGVYKEDGTEFCPHQSITLWREETITLHDASAQGFNCDLSCNGIADLEGGEARYLFATHELSLFLMFRARVQRGYSTESFRENLLRAQLHWQTVSKTGIGSGVVKLGALDPPPSVEIVSYERPLLHVRVRARSNWQGNSFREEATQPYACLVQSLYGIVPTICTRVGCRYTTDDRTQDAHVTLDLRLPIADPTP